MGCGVGTLKSCIALISLCFWGCAVALVVIGILIISEYGHISELAKSTEILIPSMIIIGAGVFLFVVGIIGCIGGLKGNKCALTTFFILMLIVIVGEVAAVAFGFNYRHQAEDHLTDKLHKMLEKCANHTADDTSTVECNEIDFLQHKLKCCGSDSYTDWYKDSTANYSIPQSCCRETNCKTPRSGTNQTIADETIYTDGCATKTADMFLEYFTWIFVATIVIVIFQVLGLVATCVMLFRSQETPYLSLDSQGYRI